MGPTRQLREARPANRLEAGVLVDLVDSERARDDAKFVMHGIEVVPDLPKREKRVCASQWQGQLENRGCGAPPCFASLV